MPCSLILWRPILTVSPSVTVARPSTVGEGIAIPGTQQAARVAWSGRLRPKAAPTAMSAKRRYKTQTRKLRDRRLHAIGGVNVRSGDFVLMERRALTKLKIMIHNG